MPSCPVPSLTSRHRHLYLTRLQLAECIDRVREIKDIGARSKQGKNASYSQKHRFVFMASHSPVKLEDLRLGVEGGMVPMRVGCVLPFN